MDEQIVAYPYKRILFINKKGTNYDTYYKDIPPNLSYVEEARCKNYIVSDSISMKGLEKQKTDSIWVVA